MTLVNSSIPFVYILKLTNNRTVSEIRKKVTATPGVGDSCVYSNVIRTFLSVTNRSLTGSSRLSGLAVWTRYSEN